MPPGAVVRAVRRVHYPSFDDIDMPRLEQYLETNRQELTTVLGAEDTARLFDAAAAYGRAHGAWHGREPRVPSKLLRLALGVVDVPRWVDVVRTRAASSP